MVTAVLNQKASFVGFQCKYQFFCMDFRITKELVRCVQRQKFKSLYIGKLLEWSINMALKNLP